RAAVRRTADPEARTQPRPGAEGVQEGYRRGQRRRRGSRRGRRGPEAVRQQVLEEVVRGQPTPTASPRASRSRSRASAARALRIRRRSRSEVPPHPPWSIRLASAYSRHSVRTGQSAHTRRATSTPTPSEGKKRLGGLSAQLPRAIHSVSTVSAFIRGV